MLPDNVKLKASRVVAAIEGGSVSEGNIELLMIWLRETAPNDSAFREIAHFVAHAKRNSGQTFEALYKLYCRWRAYSLYQYKKQHLDLHLLVDKWFVDFLLYQMDELGSKVLKQKHGFSLKAARQLIERAFRKDSGGYRCTQSPQLIGLVQEAFSFIKVSPLYSKEQVLSSFRDTLLSAGLMSRRDQLDAHLNKVLLCILLLMNKRTFHIGKDVIGETTLTAPVDGFGKLQPLELRGLIKIPEFPGIIVTLVTTDLAPADWVHPQLLIEKETNLKGHFWTTFDEQAHVQATEQEGRFVLARQEQA